MLKMFGQEPWVILSRLLMKVHFKTWLKNTKALAIEGEEIIISVDSIFAIEMLTTIRGVYL